MKETFLELSIIIIIVGIIVIPFALLGHMLEKYCPMKYDEGYVQEVGGCNKNGGCSFITTDGKQGYASYPVKGGHIAYNYRRSCE